MLTRCSHFLSVALLSFLLLFGGTSMEFIHGFANHTDTVHHDNPDGSLSFETQHHHCGFLSLSIPAFDADDTYPVIHFVVLAEYTVAPVDMPVATVSRKASCYYLRGPPTA